MPNDSRGRYFKPLAPGQWTTLCQLEDPYIDPAYTYHHVHFVVMADVINTAHTHFEVHESENGINWRRLAVTPAVLVPGGSTEIETTHTLRHVRLVMYSTGYGVIELVKATPTAQVIPGFLETPPVIESLIDPLTITEGPPIWPPPQWAQVVGYTLTVTLNWEPIYFCIPWDQTSTDLKISLDFPVIGGGGPSNGDWCWWTYPNLDLYVRDVEADEVIYSGNMAGVSLTLDQDAYPGCFPAPLPPEVITGTFTEANSFYIWYNQVGWCAPEQDVSVRQILVTNTGTANLLVNGVLLPPGDSATLGDYEYAGYATGDMSAWLGGTPVTV